MSLLNKSNFKQNPKKTFEKDIYTAKQNLLYKQALYGLKIYTAEELFEMDPFEKKKIANLNSRTQQCITNWKNLRIIALSNLILATYCNNSSFIKDLIDNSDKHFVQKTPCNLSFQDLKMSKEMIIEKLISERILPPNFYEL